MFVHIDKGFCLLWVCKCVERIDLWENDLLKKKKKKKRERKVFHSSEYDSALWDGLSEKMTYCKYYI